MLIKMVLMSPVLYIVRILMEKQLKEKIRVYEELLSDGVEEVHGSLERYSNVMELASEEGEIEVVEEVEVAFDPKVHGRLFTENIVKLLNAIATNSFNSISELARYLGRNVANVYRDLKWLEQLGLVYLERSGKNVIPRILVLEYGLRFY